MADISESSSDESFIGDIQTRDDSLKAYQFEPRRDETASDSEQSEEEVENESTSEEEITSRLTDVDWCSCGHCSVALLQSDKECICCNEKQAIVRKAVADAADDQPCVINNPDFRTLCLTEAVLRNVLVSLNNIRMDNWEVNPPNHRGMRYAAYRQFTWWVHGRLGSGRRRVIPACATHAIRQTFPKGELEEYRGFSSGDDSD